MVGFLWGWLWVVREHPNRVCRENTFCINSGELTFLLLMVPSNVDAVGCREGQA
jgi:hypothetical protein